MIETLLEKEQTNLSELIFALVHQGGNIVTRENYKKLLQEFYKYPIEELKEQSHELLFTNWIINENEYKKFGFELWKGVSPDEPLPSYARGMVVHEDIVRIRDSITGDFIFGLQHEYNSEVVFAKLYLISQNMEVSSIGKIRDKSAIMPAIAKNDPSIPAHKEIILEKGTPFIISGYFGEIIINAITNVAMFTPEDVLNFIALYQILLDVKEQESKQGRIADYLARIKEDGITVPMSCIFKYRDIQNNGQNLERLKESLLKFKIITINTQNIYVTSISKNKDKAPISTSCRYFSYIDEIEYIKTNVGRERNLVTVRPHPQIINSLERGEHLFVDRAVLNKLRGAEVSIYLWLAGQKGTEIKQGYDKLLKVTKYGYSNAYQNRPDKAIKALKNALDKLKLLGVLKDWQELDFCNGKRGIEMSKKVSVKGNIEG